MNEQEQFLLVAEDNDDDWFLLQRALRQTSIQKFARVHDGQQAIDYLDAKGTYTDRAQFPAPNIILLDLKMPFVSGFEVLSWLRQREQFQPIIAVVFSSSPNQKDVHQAYQMGANGYLCKPSGIQKLVEVMDVFKRYWFDVSFLPRIVR